MSISLPNAASSTATPSVAVAPLGGWRRAFGDSALVAAAPLFGHGLGAVTSLLLRWLLDPALMGIWQGLKLFLSYGNYAGLGVSKAAAREVSQAAGSGDHLSAQRAVNLGFTVNTLTSGAYALALLAAAAWLAWRGERSPLNTAWAIGLAAMAALTMLQRYVTYQVSILRARQGFRASSWLQVQEAVLTLAVSGAAVWAWGVYGLFVSALVVLVASNWYLRGEALPLRLAWDGREIRRLMAIGGPLLLAGIASSLFRSLDKLMILAYLDDGEFQLGCYSLALMLTTQLYGLANMLAAVMGPRYSELFGKTGSRADVARLAARATEPLAAALALPAALAIAVAPPLLSWFLPRYQPGLEPLLWLVAGTVAVSLALPASGYLVAVDRGPTVLVVLLTSITVAALGNHWALVNGLGLRGVAMAMLVADVVYLVFTAGISLWPHLVGRERWRYLVCLVAGTLPPLGLAAVLEIAPASRDNGLLALASATIVGVLGAGLIVLAWKHGGWGRVVNDE